MGKSPSRTSESAHQRSNDRVAFGGERRPNIANLDPALMSRIAPQ
jgi:hypothetical protein